MTTEDTETYLRAAGVGVLVTTPGGSLPQIRYWGADLGDLGTDALADVDVAAAPVPVDGGPDRIPELGVLPEHAAGWNGRPGLTGHRQGTGWSPRFALRALDVTAGSRGSGGRIVATGADDAAGLGVRVELELLASGLLRQRARVEVPAGGAGGYVVDGLTLALPVPPVATELLDLAGRWGRERAPQRAPFLVGTHTRESRRGRTGPDAPLVLAAGTPGFGFRSGEIWAVHVAWSGNHRSHAERTSEGVALLGGGELLLPGEVRLGAGDHYTSPWIYAAYGVGLDAIAHRFHEQVRAGRTSRPQPVVLNTWEATYYRHDPERLLELARRGAEVGAERYVLDDGWFGNRRDETSGLGDWFVDEERWPGGLAPLVSAIRELGMDFGLWVEPEMVNPDSDLARAHPDWIM
ncbi:MAG: alpha-galactosidase, partial [Nocardioidaceae bacterium]